MQRFRNVVWIVGALTLAGCSSFGGVPAPLAVYDIKPQGVEPVRVNVPITDMEVRAPSWLSSSAMQYRLEPVSTLERRAYGTSRWAGMPAEMVQMVIARIMETQTTATGSGCRLRIDLDEFIQLFKNARTSVAHVEMRARLLAPRTEALVAERLLRVEVPAPSADAAGGVAAMRDGVSEAALALAQWLNEFATSAEGERSVVSRCAG